MTRPIFWACLTLAALGGPSEALSASIQERLTAQLRLSAAQLGGIDLSSANTSRRAVSPIKCDGVTDNTAAINAELATGRPIILAPQPGFCRVSDSLAVVKPGQIFVGSGNQSIIKLVRATGAPAVPLFWMKRSATGARIDNLWIDQNAADLTQPATCASTFSPYFGQAIVVEADNAILTRIHVENAWDNGLGIGYVDEHCGEHRGQPAGVQVSLLSGRNNGQGMHTLGGLGRQGALFDDLTGSGVTVDGIYDRASYGCFIIDYGGAASGSFRNIQCNGTVWDKTTPRSKSDTGIAAYIGGTDSTIAGLEAINPGQLGIWIDTYASAVTVSGCEIKGSRSHGILIKGASDITLRGCRERNIGYRTTPATASAIKLDSTLAPIDRLLITDNAVSHDGSPIYNAFGVSQIGSHPVRAYIAGSFEGTIAPVHVPEGVTVEDLSSGHVVYTNLPTSPEGLPRGTVWSDNGLLKTAP